MKTWTSEEINQEWLAGSELSVPMDQVLECFNRVERLLGTEWIISCRGSQPGNRMTGAGPTLKVISMGQKLAVLERSLNSDRLLARITRGDHSAFSELSALALCGQDEAGIDLELEVPIEIAGRSHARVPDFRVRKQGEEWAYVEVTAPGMAELESEAKLILEQLTACLHEFPRGASLEVFLRREPSSQETLELVRESVALAKVGGTTTKDIPDLAILLLNHGPPGQAVIDDHGEPVVPRIAVARGLVEANMPQKQICVRMPYSDERAEGFLTTEAKQLPPGFPGLVMVDAGRTPSAMKSWISLIQRRFQPAMHTRVSAVCLFFGAVVPSTNGFDFRLETTVILNKYTANPLSEWLLRKLTAYKWVDEK